MEKRKGSIFSIMAGAGFILYALVSISGTLGYSSLLYILQIVAFIAVGVMLFMKLDDKITGIGFGVLGLLFFVSWAIWLSRSDIFSIIFDLIPAAFFMLIVESFFLKKLPAEKYAILYGYLPVLYFMYLVWFQFIGDTFNAIEFYGGRAFDYLAYIAMLIGMCSCAAMCAKKDEERPHPLGLLGGIVMLAGWALGVLVALISVLIYGRVYVFDGFAFTGVLWVISFLALIAGAAMLPLMALPYTAPEKAAATNQSGNGYISLSMHIVLLLFTGGIWQLIWIYKTTEFLNRVKGQEHSNPTSSLLLCMFIPFYSIFWFYKQGQKLDAYTREKGANLSEMATVCLILGIFIPFVAAILMQDRLNKLSGVEGSVPSNNNYSSADSDAEKIENIRKLKELLDCGAITQEEFDAKKSQILG